MAEKAARKALREAKKAADEVEEAITGKIHVARSTNILQQ
jgi:hypothetical protein